MISNTSDQGNQGSNAKKRDRYIHLEQEKLDCIYRQVSVMMSSAGTHKEGLYSMPLMLLFDFSLNKPRDCGVGSGLEKLGNGSLVSCTAMVNIYKVGHTVLALAKMGVPKVAKLNVALGGIWKNYIFMCIYMEIYIYVYDMKVFLCKYKSIQITIYIIFYDI